MSLSAAQKKKLTALAAEMKVDPAELIAEAEAMLAEKATAPSGSKPADKPPPPSKAPKTEPTPAVEQPKLFMYHLPFVTVNEVRTKWLGLEAWSPEEGGDDVAAGFAAAFTPASATPPTDSTAPAADDSTLVRDAMTRAKPRKRKAT